MFKSLLENGQKYEMVASLVGYGEVSDRVDLSNEKFYKEIRKTFEMLPMVEGQKMVLNKLFFDQGLAVIKDESIEELEKIKNLMKENPNMEILLEGHTDNQGDMKLNIKLAEDRVLAVKNYLSADGSIVPDRIAIKSWGPYKPIMRNTSEEARKKNRRVEFTIVKM
jgi:outer membrane protein OmpA-like peptidoglycan-associated protein